MITPTFSVITAVRNGLIDLQITAESLLEQTSLDFEWIIIDAASIDGTSGWLANFTTNRFKLNWISEPDEGIADAWNKGIIRASGSQILILNAGDIYDKKLIETFLNEVSFKKITCCHARLLRQDGYHLGVFKAKPDSLWRGMHLPHNWCSVPRDVYFQIGLYRKIPHAMDFDWFFQYYKKFGVAGFKVIDVVLGEYKLGGHSDINYQYGFLANEEIMIENGMNKWLARIIRIIYTFRHRMVRLFRG